MQAKLDLGPVKPKEVALTVVSFGAGQDTFYFVWRCMTDPEFKAKHIKGKWLIIGSDTGNEHKHTYEAVEFMKQMCAYKEYFVWITPDMGFHGNHWKSLTHQYKRNSTIGSAAYRQTCTSNLKVNVVDRYVEFWLEREYGYGKGGKFDADGKFLHTGKRAYHQFYKEHGKIRLILGFAAQEESRTEGSDQHDPLWKRKTVERYFPLINDGTDRQKAIDYLEANVPMRIYPSNCRFCFYQSDQEIVWLWRNDPEGFAEWVAMEAAKIAKGVAKGVEKNYGVYGKITLQEKLNKALEKYGHWTDEQLDEYKYSHGHCIKSKY